MAKQAYEMEAQGFGERLTALMRERGYKAPRSAMVAADPKALSEAVGVSLEMARRYIKGSALPRPDKRREIAGWLGVRQAYLDYGELPVYEHEHTGGKVDPVVLSACISAVRSAATRLSEPLSDEQIAKTAAFLYADMAKGETIRTERIIDLLKILA